MRHRTFLILPAALVALLVAAPVAAAKKTYKYSSTVRSAPVSTSNGYPNVGGSAVFAGSLESTPFGRGAVIDRVTVTGQPQPNVLAFQGTELDFFADGAAANTFTGTATVQADGSQTFVIRGRFTQGRRGGTGRYKGATGSYTFTGTIPAGANVITGSSTGTMTF